MTGHVMAGLDLAQGWRFHLAALDRIRAARVEVASHRRFERTWYVTLHDALNTFDCRIGHRHGCEQRFRVGMQRPGEQRGLVRVLDDAAEIHDRDAVRDVLY